MTQTNLSRYRDALSKLIGLGDQMLEDLVLSFGPPRKRAKEVKVPAVGSTAMFFRQNYQKWYTEAYSVLRQLLPERVEEFESFYKPGPRRKIITVTTYTIQDWLSGDRSCY